MDPNAINTTIIIPVKNDRRVLDCVASIDQPCPVLVVVNGSPRLFFELAKRTLFNCCVVTCPQAGLGRAYNYGLDLCTTEYAILMDADCVFSEGTIQRLIDGFRSAPLSKGRVVFRYSSLLSKFIAKYREHHTSDWINAYSPPLGLSRSLVKHFLGSFFDDGLEWAEDLDFDFRVQEKGIRIAYDPDAIVYHPPLRIAQDLQAAKCYGQGYAQGVKRGIFPKPEVKTFEKRFISEARHMYNVAHIKGFGTALYSLIWRQYYRAGFRISKGGSS